MSDVAENVKAGSKTSLDVETYLSCGTHIGTKVKTKDMSKFPGFEICFGFSSKGLCVSVQDSSVQITYKSRLLFNENLSFKLMIDLHAKIDFTWKKVHSRLL